MGEVYDGHYLPEGLALKRRSFLKSSFAAGIAVALPKVVFLPANAQREEDRKENLMAHMIWSADSVSVAIREKGSAAKIASSSNGSLPAETSDLHSVFAREFELEKVPLHASIRLFSYTRYRLYINGEYCGRGPSRFQNQRPEFDTRDIRAALRPGKNLVVVLVHRDAPTGRIMHHEPGFAAILELGQGPAAKRIPTDTSWVARPELSFGMRDAAWASIEENIDARKGLDLHSADLSLAGWPHSVPVGGPDFFPVWPRTTPLQKETLRDWINPEAHAAAVLKSGSVYTLDLPEIIQGYHDVVLHAESGSEIEVSYLLPEGATSGKSTYIARDGIQRYMGGDTFAFNRLSIRLISGQVTLTRANAFEVRYPFERAGEFECSDPMLSRLWRICARSLELLSEDAYVDCADRERVEWTDDSPPAFDCTRVMMCGPQTDGHKLWSDNRLLKALLRRIALTQQPDGQIKAHSCSERWDIHAIMEDRSCDWVVQLREHYDSSSDKALVQELWPTLRRLMQWFLERRTARGLVLAREWEVWDNPLRYQICEGTGLNAMVYRALQDASYLGSTINELEDSNSYAQYAEKLKHDFNTLLWNSHEGTYDGALFGPGSKMNEQLNGKMFPGPIVNGRYRPTVQAALFALYSGIVPTERLRSVRDWVLAHAEGVTTPMSHYYLFAALYGMNAHDQDEEVLRRMRIGWKGQADSPWQTTWEDLDGNGSKAHVYGMVPGFFLTAFALGVRRDGPVANRSILIEPRCGDLSWANGVAVTEFGPVTIRWVKGESDRLTIDLKTPPGIKVKLRLYKGNGEEMLLDGRTLRGVTNDGWLELSIPTGQHVIQYPA
ncbi:MAG: hypothetical protein KGN79_11605 [Acidobacteriota bacterium]|nr:hypothetical protein [Acidobacteriota bacterium]